MKIWFVSIFDPTPVDDNQNTRYNCLVREAHKRGHQITFWASTFRHNVKQQRFSETTSVEKYDGLKLNFIKTAPYSGNISLRRVASHNRFAKDIIREFDRSGETPDVIMMAFPPISSSFRISEWAKLKGIPVIMDIIDPWPDVFTAHFKKLPRFAGDVLLWPMRKRLSATLRQITAVTGISNQYVEWASGYQNGHVKTRCFYPAVEFDQMQSELHQASERVEKNGDCLNIIYAGSLGYSYDIETILKAASQLDKSHGDRIHFTIAGDGPQKSRILEYLDKHSNLEYVGRIPKDKLMEYYYLSDIGMTQHIKGATQSVTYKLFDLLASGLPILNSLESEMKEIIVSNRVGLHNKPGDSDKLVENIIWLLQNKDELEKMKANAVKLTKQLGDSKKVYAEALDFIESVSRVA